MANICSDGSIESQSPLMEQEDIAVLTHDVRNFKEALGKLRRTLNPDQEVIEPQRVEAHERLGDVLRILRNVLEKYPALQSSELLLSASTLIQHLKCYGFDNSKSGHKQCFELIDQLALAFSSRVSEYLMGDLDSSLILTTLEANKRMPCTNISEDSIELEKENYAMLEKKESVIEELDEALLNLEQGVEFALNRAKVWSKYAKDIIMYIEKRCHLEMEYTRNLKKLAQTVRSLINEETHLPFQSIYCTALDYDMENSNLSKSTCAALLGAKFLEPLSERRSEHEKERRQLKELWIREVARTHDIVLSMRQDRNFYMQCLQESNLQVAEAESKYNASISKTNEGHKHLLAVKNEILQKIRNLLKESDHVLQTATVSYFQFQHSLSIPISLQFRTLYESSQLYEPGSQYLEAVKQLLPPTAVAFQAPFTFQKFSDSSQNFVDQERKSTDSLDNEDLFTGTIGLKEPSFCSDNDSINSATSSHDADSYHNISRRPRSHDIITHMGDPTSQTGVGYMSYITNNSNSLSKAAESHAFRKLKTPSRCRECDSYVYFQGFDCSECGLACHKKCLETLAIQCGHKRLPRKMTTFGVDLAQHLTETLTSVPHIVCKCIDEIDSRGKLIKGIYRVSGVKSRVEKLCQAFENGAELVDLTDIHPNVIANVLKLYLRQLPEPLLSFQLYPEFIRIAQEYSSNSPAEMKNAKEELKELMKKLPRQYYLTLAMLTLHLKRISNYAEVNNMPPSNLGIVFGPTLLRTAEGSASLNSLVDTIHQTRTIELLIMYADDLFSAQEVATAKEHSLKIVHSSHESGLLCRSFSFVDRNKKLKDTERITNMAVGSESNQNISNVSDDEMSFFLCGDELSSSKSSREMKHINCTPKIFKGSLKDYQGLEGLSSLSMKSLDNDDHTYQKLRKSPSATSKETTQTELQAINYNVSVKKVENEKVLTTSREDWCNLESAKPLTEIKGESKSKRCANRTESSADSDYSFESRISSVESHSLRELEETNEAFLELPSSWPKKRIPVQYNNERQVLESGESPFSSLSHSLDESQGSDFADELDHSLQKSLTHVHSQTWTQLFNVNKQDQGRGVYIPVLQKQVQNQESSQICSSQQAYSQCKSHVNNSCSEKQDLSTIKFSGKDDQNKAENTKQSQGVSSTVAAIKVSSSHQMAQCTHIKSSHYNSEDMDTKLKLNQLMFMHKEGSSDVELDNLVNDVTEDTDVL